MAIALGFSLMCISLLYLANVRLRKLITTLKINRSKRYNKLLLEVNNLTMQNKELLEIIKENK